MTDQTSAFVAIVERQFRSRFPNDHAATANFPLSGAGAGETIPDDAPKEGTTQSAHAERPQTEVADLRGKADLAETNSETAILETMPASAAERQGNASAGDAPEACSVESGAPDVVSSETGGSSDDELGKSAEPTSEATVSEADDLQTNASVIDALVHPGAAENDTAKNSVEVYHDESTSTSTESAPRFVLETYSPVAAGEDPAKYARLSNAVSAEIRPRQLLEQFCADQLVQTEWNRRRLHEASRCHLNSKIAGSVFSRLVNEEVTAAKMAQLRQWGGTPTQQDIESWVDPGRVREIKTLAFAAVAGDRSAIASVEQKLGAGAVGMDAYMDFEGYAKVELQLDRLLRSQIAGGDATCRQLEKLEKKRRKSEERKRKIMPSPGSPATQNVGNVVTQIKGAEPRSHAVEERMATGVNDPGTANPQVVETATVFAPKSEDGSK
jgi:hypothetical protein